MISSLNRALARAREPLLVLALFAIVFHKFWSHSIIFRDSFRLYAPSKFLIARALRDGEIWAWNPGQFLGMPFVADIIAGWFYPGNLVYALLPFSMAHRLFILGHYPLAAIGMLLWLRERGLGPAPRLTGAIVFALSGYLVSQAANLTFLIGPALAPFALWAMERMARRGTKWALAAGAVLALQVLAGEPQSAAVTGIIIAAMSAHRMVAAGQWRRETTAVTVVMLSALALSLVQVLPTYELLRTSIRRPGLSFEEASFFSFHPVRLIELLWPNPFGNIYPELTYWGQFTLEPSPTQIPYPWSLTNYLGLPALFLAAVGLINHRRRPRWGLAAGLALFLVLAGGRHTPVFGWFYQLVPGFDRFRYPSKYLAWFTLLLAAAAAHGLADLIEGREKGAKIGRGGLAFFAAVILSGIAMALAGPVLAERAGLEPGSPTYLAAVAVIHQGLGPWLAVNLILGAVFLIWSRRRLPDPAAAAIFFIVLAADLGRANVAPLPAGPPEIFDFPAVAATQISLSETPAPGHYRILREDFGFRDANPALADYSFIERECIWERNSLLANFDNMDGFENLLGYNQAALSQGLKVLDRPRPRTLEILNVGYVISPFGQPPIPGLDTEVVYADQQNDLVITRLKGAWPRAYWVPGAVFAPDEDTALKLFAHTDLSRAAVIIAPDAPGPDPGDHPLTSASIVSHQPDEVILEINAPAAGWLVLSDRFYPGWKAWVNDVETEIYQANVLVRAVRVGPGPSRVRFSYEPKLLRIGAVVSLPAWVLVLAAGAWIVFKRRSI